MSKRRQLCRRRGLRIKIGCVTFTPHGWDVFQASELAYFYMLPMNSVERTIWDLCRAGF